MFKVRLLLLSLCSLLLVSCSEYSAVLKSNDYEFKYEAAKALYAEGHYRQASELFGVLLAPLKGTSPFTAISRSMSIPRLGVVR